MGITGAVIIVVAGLAIGASVRWPFAVPTSDRPSSRVAPTVSSAEGSVTVNSETGTRTQYTCWNGRTVASLGSCSTPKDEDGLKYLFPSLRENLDGEQFDCAYTEYPNRDKLTFSYDCPLLGGTLEDADQLIRYRYWSDTKASRTHYRKVFKEGSHSAFVLDGKIVGTVYANHAPAEYGRYVIAFVMLDGHMCLSIEGASEDLLNQMLPQARFRAAKEFYGYVGDSPSEGVWER